MMQAVAEQNILPLSCHKSTKQQQLPWGEGREEVTQDNYI